MVLLLLLPAAWLVAELTRAKLAVAHDDIASLGCFSTNCSGLASSWEDKLMSHQTFVGEVTIWGLGQLGFVMSEEQDAKVRWRPSWQRDSPGACGSPALMLAPPIPRPLAGLVQIDAKLDAAHARGDVAETLDLDEQLRADRERQELWMSMLISTVVAVINKVLQTLLVRFVDAERPSQVSRRETRLMLLSTQVYLLNYVGVIFAVHSPLTNGANAYAYTDLIVSRNDTMQVVSGATSCVQGMLDLVHPDTGNATASAAAAGLAAAAADVGVSCAEKMAETTSDAFISLIERLVYGISHSAWYGRSGPPRAVIIRLEPRARDRDRPLAVCRSRVLPSVARSRRAAAAGDMARAARRVDPCLQRAIHARLDAWPALLRPPPVRAGLDQRRVRTARVPLRPPVRVHAQDRGDGARLRAGRAAALLHRQRRLAGVGCDAEARAVRYTPELATPRPRSTPYLLPPLTLLAPHW